MSAKDNLICLASSVLGLLTALVLLVIFGYFYYPWPLPEHPGMLTAAFLTVVFGSGLGWLALLTKLTKRYGGTAGLTRSM
jgi:hypothetical protein